MIKRTIGFLFTLLFFYSIVQAQTASVDSTVTGDLGIFSGLEEMDNTVDEKMVYKKINPTDEDIVYDKETSSYHLIADKTTSVTNTDLKNKFLYASVSGSFQLSAKMILSCSGNISYFFGGFHLHDSQSNYIHFYHFVQGYDSSSKVQTYAFSDQLTNPIEYNGPVDLYSNKPNLETYLRLTLYANEQQILCEWSKDGVYWNSAPPLNLTLGTTIDVGLQVGSIFSVDQKITATFQDVRIMPIKPVCAVRTIEQISDQSVRVQLRLNNQTDNSQQIQLEEYITGNADVTQVSHKGTVNNLSDSVMNLHRIFWSVTLPPGESNLTYTLTTDKPTNSNLYLFTNGDNSIPVFGETMLNRPEQIVERNRISQWRSWTIEDGLFNSDTKYITSGNSGRVFVSPGSFNQNNFYVQQFDGYAFQSIPLKENMQGMIFEATDKSLFFLDEYTRYLYKNNIMEDLGQPDWQICKDSYGDPVTIGGESYSLIKSNHDFLGKPALKYLFVPVDRHRVLLLKAGSIEMYNTHSYEQKTLLNASSTNIGEFYHMIQAKEGGVWISGKNGVIKLDYNSQKNNIKEYLVPPQYPLHEFIYPVEGASNHLLLLAKHNQSKANITVILNEKFIPRYVSNDPIPIALSSEDGIWNNENLTSEYVATSYNLSNRKQLVLQNEKSYNFMVKDTTVEPDNAFWFAAAHGIARHSPSVWRKPTEVKDISTYVSAIDEDKQGNIWFLNETSLIKSGPEGWKRYSKPNGVVFLAGKNQGLYVLPDGRLLAFLGPVNKHPKPLLVFDPHTERFDYFFHPENHRFEYIAPGLHDTLLAVVYAKNQNRLDRYHDNRFESDIFIGEAKKRYFIRYIYQTQNGDIWFCSESPYYLQWFRNGIKQDFPEGQEFGPKQPVSMVEKSEGVLWVCSLDSIYEFNGQSWTLVRRGFDKISSMIKSGNGRIWIAAKNGIFCFKEGNWIIYNTEDGLGTDNMLDIFEDSKGRIWVGATDGIYLYHPEADLDPPQTYIPEKENLKDFASKGEVRITFSGVDKWKYTEQNRLLYSYRLNEGEWTPFNTPNVATFANMPPDDYTIEVQAMDRNWNIDPSPASFSFRVNHVPIQERAWFIPLIAGTISLILLLAILAIVSRFQLAEFASNLESMVEARTRELHQTQRNILSISEREQQRIGQDLHDDVVQDLVGIAINSEVLLEELLAESPKRAEELQKILTKMDDATVKTQRLARGLSPVSIDKLGLVGSLQNICTHIRDYYGMECYYHGDQKIPHLDSAQRLNLYRIAQEATNNAIKHAAANQIVIQLSHTTDRLTLEIRDNGKGFDGGGSILGMGLHIMNYRANTIGAEFDIKSVSGQGTSVVCVLPLSKNVREEEHI